MNNNHLLIKYRASFIINIKEENESLETIIERISHIIISNQGTIEKVDKIGNKEFSRVTDKKLSNAFYLQIKFNGLSYMPKKIYEKLHLNKNIYRFLIEKD